MSDVKRWVDDGASEPVRTLLAAAREEQPGEAGVQRTLVALGAGSAIVTGASHAAGGAGAATLAKSAGGASSLAAMTKWGLIGALGAATTFGAVRATTDWFEPASPHGAASAPASPTKSAEVGTRAAPRAAGEGTPPSAPTDEAAAAVAAPGGPLDEAATNVVVGSDADRRGAPPAIERAQKGSTVTADRAPSPQTETAVSSERILEEVRAIDRARSALSRGDARGTLAALDGYRDGFSERRFEPEALYLRMEALERLGDTAGAKAAAGRLLSAFPNAPQAARAKVVAGQ